ncbi:MAG: PadR family transcriptional regulator [Chloroflexi bacterium]|jgi:DNA-binding PadR family transcriptional regulator|nr:PadR family transcriptional regulator [Chloroflexota bacterium]BCY17154.1 PadR family transcriptional regulator [Leptolinea sp. HRD-7]
MNRNKNLPLSEINFYILLAVSEPAHGYLIMQKVEELSRGEVRVAAGTLYGAIENLLKARFIVPVDGDDNRRKVYSLTEEGRQIVQMDIERMKLMISQAENCLQERKG